jgi:PAS domain S-box-containing protein
VARAGRTPRLQTDAEVVRFLSVADDLPEIAWRSASDPRDRVFNERWFQLTGMLGWDAIGSGWRSAIHRDDIERCDEAHELASQRRGPFEIDYRVKNARGEYCWVRERAQPSRRNSYAYLGICALISAAEARVPEASPEEDY